MRHFITNYCGMVTRQDRNGMVVDTRWNLQRECARYLQRHEEQPMAAAIKTAAKPCASPQLPELCGTRRPSLGRPSSATLPNPRFSS